MDYGLMLVLHSHLPYLKHHGEDWLFEAMAETYVPLVMTWSRLLAEDVRACVTISLSPTLIQQLASDYIRKGFLQYLKECEKKARSDERHYSAAGEQELARVARDYQRFYQEVRRSYQVDLGGDLLGAFKDLRERVPLEIITTAATHSYLPLLKDQSGLERQIAMGKASFAKHLGFEPRGFWLPECGYYPGIEEILTRHGFEYVFVDGHAIEGGRPAQVFSGPYGISEEEVFSETGLSTYSPYMVEGHNLKVFGRNAMISQQVWSKDNGYPGDPHYREYHKKASQSGLKYWRVTDRGLDQGSKAPYDREEALRITKQHAGHFVRMVGDMLKEADKIGYPNPLVVACYDTELFGHWWWEGVDWLEEVARQVAGKHNWKMVLPSRVLAQRDPIPSAKLFESSWGAGGKHLGWSNNETSWMWDTLDKAREELSLLEGTVLSKWAERAHQQAIKELMLMESSDWFFMVTNNYTRDYAVKRFLDHFAKLIRLTSLIKLNRFDAGDQSWVMKIEQEDRCFN
ncbi:MAG: glycoside hydrolase family 57 protein [Syntrophomonadaceae bacterium]|nr:glycoside hydrolase family 57 protein [Syntrophomonadaceae bacterium]